MTNPIAVFPRQLQDELSRLLDSITPNWQPVSSVPSLIAATPRTGWKALIVVLTTETNADEAWQLCKHVRLNKNDETQLAIDGTTSVSALTAKNGSGNYASSAPANSTARVGAVTAATASDKASLDEGAQMLEAPRQSNSFSSSNASSSTRRLPVVLIVTPATLSLVEGNEHLFDEICVSPFASVELDLRLKLASQRSQSTRAVLPSTLIKYGPLEIDPDTYQASVDGTKMDLTHMEFELLKYLTMHPGRVFTRETLLTNVWGYDYFGGARTVDVHVRRLRAKLGEPHSGLIVTLRSVGYRLGNAA